MAIEERLPPGCAFAISVLQERETDPEGVPEEAVEAAQQHLATCIRCLSSPPMIAAPRKKKKVRRPVEPEYAPTVAQAQTGEAVARTQTQAGASRVSVTIEEAAALAPEPVPLPAPAPKTPPTPPPSQPQAHPATGQNLPAVLENLDGLDCAQ